MTLERKTPLQSDAAKTREWQARGARAYAEKRRSQPVTQIRSKKVTSTRAKPRRNDAPWRAEVLASRGAACVRCGDTAHVQADHIWPRSQGGPSVVENGLPLCGEFSRNTPGGCHPAKTASRIVIDPRWLTDAQITWLAKVGWVAWDVNGEPYGRGHQHFGRMARPMIERVDADGNEEAQGRRAR